MVIDSEKIYAKANELVKRCGTRDTLRIARETGIEVREREDFDRLLGMYVCRWKHRYIFLNGRMDPYTQQLVCGHEIGHDVLHRALAGQDTFHEFVLFNMKDETEYEANALAAHLLIDDRELMRCLKSGMDTVQTARSLNTHINLLLVKLAEMNRLGEHFELPYTPPADFLGRLDRPDAQ
ncbi:MAG: ImmA/IrrE family metallo-endopeptidase [Lachnospiraceae bacterium]|nr:ImmA/IrrE family metallo-endopeptidase [Lachnospiraceae bacterium]